MVCSTVSRSLRKSVCRKRPYDFVQRRLIYATPFLLGQKENTCLSTSAIDKCSHSHSSWLLGSVLRVRTKRIESALGSIAYEMFWIALGLACCPKNSPLKMSIGVFLLTCALEFLQLWQPPLLQTLRTTLLGRLVLGNTFSWSDFPAYSIGSFLGYLWVRFLAQTTRNA